MTKILSIYRFFREDLANLPNKERFDYVLMFLKIRASDENKSNSLISVAAINNNAVEKSQTKKKKKIGKAEKKRLASAKLESADLIFDNSEENLLFQVSTIKIL